MCARRTMSEDMRQTRSVKKAAIFSLFLWFFSSAALSQTAADDWEFKGDFLDFRYHADQGTWDMSWKDGSLVVLNAYAQVVVKTWGEKTTLRTTAAKKRTRKASIFRDRIGEGTQIIVEHHLRDGIILRQVVRLYDKRKYLTTKVSLAGDYHGKIVSMSPFVARGDRGGGVFVGKAPEQSWVLENGYDLTFDFWVRMVRGGENSISDWNTAIFDPESGRSVVLGFVSDDRAVLSVNVSSEPGKSVVVGERSGFSAVSCVGEYTPAKGFQGIEGVSFDSETVFVGMIEKEPQRLLEEFADTVAKYYGITPWEGEIPTGWNVWATKYHHGINEENMLENAGWAAANLRKYGMSVFQVDDGWQLDEGDWSPNGKFPNGMKRLAEEIGKLGFTPGLWIAPFVVGSDSALARAHPDWLAPKNQIAETIMQKDWEILDISNPEALEWLGQLFRTLSRDWGYKVIKIDFVYYTLLSKKFHDPTVTNIEAYRNALREIKKALPEDAFLIVVGVPLSAHAGLADSIRIGLDNTPHWGDEPGYATQGMKPLVRNLARRYYLNHSVWTLHPDMFYLGSEEEVARWGRKLTPEEARTYATLTAITGGVTKIGDSFVGLEEWQTDLLRRLLPVNKRTAVPIDLFELAYPEIWSLDAGIGGYSYKVVTLFNWGQNERFGEKIEENERIIEIPLDKLGLPVDKKYVAYEFWTEKSVVIADNKISLSIMPRDTRVVAVHALPETPWLISSNRHVTGGTIDVKSLGWDQNTGQLKVDVVLTEGFEHRIRFYIPEGFELEKIETDIPGIEHSQEGRLLLVEFTGLKNEGKTLILRFKLQQEKGK